MKKILNSLHENFEIIYDKNNFVKIKYEKQKFSLKQIDLKNKKNSKNIYNIANTLVCNSLSEIPNKISNSIKYLKLINLKINSKKGLQIMDRIYNSTV